MKLGQMFMYDLVQSKTANEDFDLFCLDDIVKDFNLNMKIQQAWAPRISPIIDYVKIVRVLKSWQ